MLIVPGLNNSGPGHWQTRWQQLYPSFERVEQDRWDIPSLPAWSERLRETLSRSDRPTLIAAHSFGCLATIYGVASMNANICGALLVAPADPKKFDVAKQLQNIILPFKSIVIASTDDPWMDSRRAAYWAGSWGSSFIEAGALGHINAESELGDWEYGQELLREILD